MNTISKTHLAKYLKNNGNYTKSEIKTLIKQKRVLVNNTYQPLSYIVSDDDEVLVDGKKITKVDYVYYLYHKPLGIICTNNTKIDNNIISHLNLDRRVFCVGRLDKNTSGLILLTNDGLFANNLINATNHIEKEYEVVLKKPITDEFITKMQSQITLRGKKTLPAKLKVINNFTIHVTITEGKYHQIRRLVIYASNYIESLKRIRIGTYQLDDLKIDEIKQIKL